MKTSLCIFLLFLFFNALHMNQQINRQLTLLQKEESFANAVFTMKNELIDDKNIRVIITSENYTVRNINKLSISDGISIKNYNTFEYDEEMNTLSFIMTYSIKSQYTLTVLRNSDDESKEINLKIEITSTKFICSRYYAIEGNKITIENTEESIASLFLVKRGSTNPTEITDSFDGSFTYTFITEGVYELQYTLTSNTEVKKRTNIFFYIFQDENYVLESLITFDYPSECLSKNIPVEMTIEQSFTFDDPLDFSRIRILLIREKDGGYDTYDLERKENTFTITQSILDTLDNEPYQLAIVEKDDYAQPLYYKDAYFSSLKLERFYYKDSIILQMTCLFEDLLIVYEGDYGEDSIPLNCEYTTSPNATCVPEFEKTGLVSIYNGETLIGTTFISLHINDDINYEQSSIYHDDPSKIIVILQSKNYYLNNVKSVMISGTEITQDFNYNFEFNILSFPYDFDSSATLFSFTDEEGMKIVDERLQTIVPIYYSVVTSKYFFKYNNEDITIVLTDKLDEGSVVKYIAFNEEPRFITDEFNKTMTHTFTEPGTYHIIFLYNKKFYPTAEYIHIVQDVSSNLLSFNFPQKCSYKDHIHHITLTQNENRSADVDLSRFTIYLIRTKNDGTVERHALQRDDNTFTLSQSLLDSLDTEIYQLIIVELEDYASPLYSQDVQFSKLSVDKAYYYNDIHFTLSCLYPDIKIQKANEDISSAVALKCDFDNSLANCEFPSSLTYGYHMIIVGDIKIADTYISNTLPEANFEFSSLVRGNAMKVLVNSTDFYLGLISSIVINDGETSITVRQFDFDALFNKLEFTISSFTNDKTYTVTEITDANESRTVSYPLKVVQSHLEYDRKYLIKGQDVTITAINDDGSTQKIDKVYLKDSNDGINEIGSVNENKELVFTTENSGRYELYFSFSDESNVKYPTSEIIYIVDDVNSLLSFRAPPICCYKDKVHQIELTQSESFIETVDLSRIRVSIIRKNEDEIVSKNDLSRVGNTFTISQAMLDTLDTNLYDLVIIEQDDYAQPLYSQNVQFSTLPIDDYYYKDNVELQMTCMFTNIKIKEKDSTAEPITLTCENIDETKAQCPLPSDFKYGNAIIYVGDTIIDNDTFISSSLANANFAITNTINEESSTMTVLIKSDSFYINIITKVTIRNEKKEKTIIPSSDFTYLKNSNAVQFSLEITQGLTYKISEIEAGRFVDNNEYYLTTKNCSLIDPDTPYTYQDQCLPSCEGYVLYGWTCYDDCAQAGEINNKNFFTEDSKCVEQCSDGFGLQNETAKECVNCVDYQQRVVDGICKDACPEGTSNNDKGVCVLPEDLTSGSVASNEKTLCKDLIDGTPYCKNNGICYVSNDSPHCNCTDFYGIQCTISEKDAMQAYRYFSIDYFRGPEDGLKEINLDDLAQVGEFKTINKMLAQNIKVLGEEAQYSKLIVRQISKSSYIIIL